MGTIFFVLVTALAQLAIGVGYPYGGAFGTGFTVVSVFGWGGAMIGIRIFLAASVPSTRVYASVFTLLVSLLCTAAFMPQADKVSVFDKLSLGQYPTKASVYQGLLNLGINYPALKPPPKPVEPVEL